MKFLPYKGGAAVYTRIQGLLWCVTPDTSKLWVSGTISMCVLHTCEFADAHMLKPGHEAGLDIFLYHSLPC